MPSTAEDLGADGRPRTFSASGPASGESAAVTRRVLPSLREVTTPACSALNISRYAARMDRALHPDLVKRSPAEDDGAILTKEVMLQACAEGEGTRAQGRWVKIDIADVCGNIASAVVRSALYREYLHLIRTGDGWKIADALWLPQ